MGARIPLRRVLESDVDPSTGLDEQAVSTSALDELRNILTLHSREAASARACASTLAVAAVGGLRVSGRS
jgi:hypothetical protein